MLLYREYGLGWGWFVLLLLVPDISIAGYLAGPKVGSVAYDLVHTYLAPAILAAGMLLGVVPPMWGLPLIWLAHIGMDRLLGFGLKYPSAFKETHLSRV